jgi:hypothetical protein
MLPGLTRIAPILLAFACETALLGAPCRAMSDAALVPARPTAPADGAMIEPKISPLDVKLAWDAPHEPVPVHFFVEVVAVEQSAQHEVFAGYVDHSYTVVTLVSTSAEYAWRVYTVGLDDPVYVMSGWQRFSVLAPK